MIDMIYQCYKTQFYAVLFIIRRIYAGVELNSADSRECPVVRSSEYDKEVSRHYCLIALCGTWHEKNVSGDKFERQYTNTMIMQICVVGRTVSYNS
jgi:hypothetical protein